MPNWANDNTARVWIKIQAHNNAHTVMARLIAGADVEAADEAQRRIAQAYQELGDYLPTDIAVLGCRFAPFGSNNSVPIPVNAAWNAVDGSNPVSPVHTAKYLNIVGLAPGRSHCSIKFWGVASVAGTAADNDYTANELEWPGLTAAKNRLDGSFPLFVCRNGQQAVFSNKALSRVSSFWQTALRG